MRYIRTLDGAVLYSVGDNLRDDKGIQKLRRFCGKDDDVIFCLGDAYAKYRLEQSQKNIEERKQRRAEWGP